MWISVAQYCSLKDPSPCGFGVQPLLLSCYRICVGLILECFVPYGARS